MEQKIKPKSELWVVESRSPTIGGSDSEVLSVFNSREEARIDFNRRVDNGWSPYVTYNFRKSRSGEVAQGDSDGGEATVIDHRKAEAAQFKCPTSNRTMAT